MSSGAGTVRRVRLPGCKSLSARALILAACAHGESALTGLSDSDDTRALAGALEGLGAGIRTAGAVTFVRGWGGAPQARGVEVDLGAAGASLRFLVPVLAAGRTDVRLTGARRLFERPHGPLFDFLRDHGAHIEEEPEAVRVQGSGLSGNEWRPPLTESSQFLSGLILAAAWSEGVKLVVEGLVPSAGYVDLTLEAVRVFRGPLAVQAVHEGWFVAPGDGRAADWSIPGDPSAASFFLVALVLRGGRASFREPWSAVHPEARLLRVLFDEGLLTADADGVEATGRLPEHPLEINLDEAPDAGPALAVLGAHLPAGLRLRRVGRLRIKESDRVAGIQRLLRSLGGETILEGEDLVVCGGGLDPGGVAADCTAEAGPAGGFDPDGDHRLAMAAGIAALGAPNLAVRSADCVAKSFPRFWEEREAWIAPA